MAKSKVFWITRDADASVGDEIVIWPYRAYPQKDKHGDWLSDEGCIDMFDDALFEDWTGITLAPGQRRKARLVIKEN